MFLFYVKSFFFSFFGQESMPKENQHERKIKLFNYLNPPVLIIARYLVCTIVLSSAEP